MKCRFAYAAAVSLWLNVQVLSATFAADFTEPQQILAAIPKEILSDLGRGDKKVSAATLKANQHLAKEVEKKTAEFKIQIGNIDEYRLENAPTITRYRLVPTVDRVRIEGAKLRVLISVFMDPEEDAKLEKLRKGEKVIVMAEIGNAEIEAPTLSSDDLPTLRLSLSQAKLK